MYRTCSRLTRSGINMDIRYLGFAVALIIPALLLTRSGKVLARQGPLMQLASSRAAQRLAVFYTQIRSNLNERFPFLNTQASRVHEVAAVSATQAMEVIRVPALSDNYVWLLHEPKSGKTAVVDPSEAQPVMTALKQKGWNLDYIFNTHHHFDHTGGNMQLKKQFNGLQIVGPRADADRIPGIDIQVGDGDTWQYGRLEMRVFDTPGHTRGHITYWLPEAKALFPGDTLFALGCGRLFEGDAKTMWSSLSKMLPLPADTQVYCAHEYTQSNARFAVSVDPNNTALQQRKERIDDARSRGEPTVPSLLGEELATNPFLRPHDAGIRNALKVDNNLPDWEVFGKIRAAKDRF